MRQLLSAETVKDATARHPAVRSAVKSLYETVWRAKLLYQGAFKSPMIVTDSLGVRVVIHPYERQDGRVIVQRHDDQVAFDVMRKLLKSGDVVFDVGANFGIYSVHAARLVGTEGKVYAFEPVPTTITRLNETLALNETQQVQVVPAAVTAENGTVNINVFDDPRASGWSSLGKHSMATAKGERVQPGRQYQVKAQTLDDFVTAEGIDQIAFVKIDVEGFEADVFAGASRLLEAGRIDVICFELSEDPLVGENRQPLDVLAPLEKHGYKIFRHDGRTNRLVGPLDTKQEEARLINGEEHPYVDNYFASTKDVLANL